MHLFLLSPLIFFHLLKDIGVFYFTLNKPNPFNLSTFYHPPVTWSETTDLYNLAISQFEHWNYQNISQNKSLQATHNSLKKMSHWLLQLSAPSQKTSPHARWVSSVIKLAPQKSDYCLQNYILCREDKGFLFR